MQTVLLARHAMATRFEVVLGGDDPEALRAAGEEALDEIERLEQRLSLYRPTSEIAHLNARAAIEPVKVSPEVFALLERAADLSRATAGAFDITVGALMRCWGLSGRAGRVPGPDELAAARQCVGMHRVHLDPETTSVRLERGVALDLGAVGKGYALERAIDVLREAGVRNAFLHGGTSTAYGMGTQPGGQPWKVSIAWPRPETTDQTSDLTVCTTPRHDAGDVEPDGLATVTLDNEALSVSAPSGKSFQAGEQRFGHVLDPRSGRPVAGAALAAVLLPDATATDALSTALLTLGIQGHDALAEKFPAARTLVAERAEARLRVRARRVNILHSLPLMCSD